MSENSRLSEHIGMATQGVSAQRGRRQISTGSASHNERLLFKFSKKVVDHKLFTFITTMLTIYALIGDDCKLISTNKPADRIFDVITIVCLAIFSIEIVLSSLGKRDYFMGFFFILDVIATSTLVLDISIVSDAMLGDGEDLDKLRSGRTARVGAKAGRIVRVIRLVRILKLYKAIHEARAAAAARKKEGLENEDDWGEDEDEEERIKRMTEKASTETRVGKKLSEMTTRRVIILVLTMLIVLPFLQIDASAFPPSAAYYGADDVLELFLDWNRTRGEIQRLRYEKSVLKYMYFFNWFSGNFPSTYAPSSGNGPSSFQTQVFWMGIMSLDSSNRGYRELTENDVAWEGLEIRPSTVKSFAAQAAVSREIYPSGTMPTVAQTRLGGRWTNDCHVANKAIWRRGFSLLDQEIDGDVSYTVPCPEDLRSFEKTKYYPRITSLDQYEKWHFAFYFDTRPLQRQEASYSLMITSFICIVLCVASLRFSKDANTLVIRPVEKMIERVQIIQADPLTAIKMADEEFKMEEKAKNMREKRNKRKSFDLATIKEKCGSGGDHAEPMETVILEKTIIKLGSLLALGFGEAGANIIGHNLKSVDSAGVDGMVPGSRVEAIIGVARIGDFSTATEVLKSNVMTFVNQIAEIVHGVVSEFHGAANKNNGDTFMVVWRISGLEDEVVSRMADFSAIAFGKILGALHSSPVLATYRRHPGLQQRIGFNYKYRVCLTFGLHSGWAIEGAVGSEFKIDASYLSPNVSIAVNIEKLTSTYGVSILMTESVVDLCCREVAEKFRLIDSVTIIGASQPLDLYCLDLDFMSLEPDYERKGRPSMWNQRLRFKARQFLEVEKSQKLDSTHSTVEMFDHCDEISMMRSRYSVEFWHVFHMGYVNYLEGEWQAAKGLLTRTRSLLDVEDGPSVALLKFMESTDFEPPANWVGVHDLTHLYKECTAQVTSDGSARPATAQTASPDASETLSWEHSPRLGATASPDGNETQRSMTPVVDFQNDSEPGSP